MENEKHNQISKIVRYKPEHLAHLMEGKESWLLHEILTLALDRFIDELAAEITGEELMGLELDRRKT